MDVAPGSWLSPHSQEFVAIKHQLDLCLAQSSSPASSLSHKSLSIFVPSPSTSNPATDSRNKLALPCFIDYTGRSSSLEQICSSKGFDDLPSGEFLCVRWCGLDFYSPQVDPLNPTEKLATQYVPPGGSEIIFLFVDAEVGLSQILSKRSESKIDTSKRVLMPGFDSQYIVMKDMNDDHEDVSQGGRLNDKAGVSTPCHRYLIYDGKRLRVRAIVRFTLVTGTKSESGDNVDSSKSNNGGHKVEDSDGGSDDDAEDVYDRIDFFDAGEAWCPVTLREKMNSPAKTKQNLVPVTEEFAHIFEESAGIHNDPFVESTMGSISNALADLDDKVRQINLSYAKGEEKIYTCAKDALEQLRLESDARLAKLESVESELLRRKDALKIAQNFFESKRISSRDGTTRDKVDFLQMYKSHLMMIAALSGKNGGHEDLSPTASIQAELNTISGVRDDLEVECAIDICTSENGGNLRKERRRKNEDSLPSSEIAPTSRLGSELTAFPSPPTLGSASQPRRGINNDDNIDDVSHNDYHHHHHHYVDHPHPKFSPNKDHIPHQNDSFFSHSHSSPQHKYHLQKTQPNRVNHSTYSSSRGKRFSVAPHTRLHPTPPPVFVRKESPLRGENHGEESIYDDPSISLNYVDIDQNAEFVKRLGKYKLSDLARRREKLMNLQRGRARFQQSTLIDTNKQGNDLFFSLPSGCIHKDGAEILLYQASADGHAHEQSFDMETMKSALLDRKDPGYPTLFIFKSGAYVFGAFAPTSWQLTDDAQGEMKSKSKSRHVQHSSHAQKSFLFSLTLDIKIPYHGRTTASPGGDDKVQILGSDYMMFGPNGDLEIGEEFQVCRSNLEQSYGCGMKMGSASCLMLLAGCEQFEIDAMEIFEIRIPGGSTLSPPTSGMVHW